MYPFRKILFPVDFSERCSAILPTVAEITNQFAADLTLLHVIPDGAASLHAEVARCHREFDRFLDGTPGRHRFRRAVVPGDPPETIVQYAHNRGSDLIVFPPGNRHDIPGPLKAEVLRSARCAVWTGVGVIQPIDRDLNQFSFWTEWQLEGAR